MERSGGRATELGIFVAPGALGVLLGIWLGGTAVPAQAGVACLLAACAVLLGVQRMPVLPRAQVRLGAGGRAVAGVALLALVVVVRSLVGGAVGAQWRGLWTVTLLLVVAAFLGKVLGGMLADRLGFRVIAVGALLAMLPMIRFASSSVPAGFAAVCLIQMTMAITLAAAYRRFPVRPATVFGLFSLMLLAGALPALTQVAGARIVLQMPAILVGITALVLFGGLSLCAKSRAETAAGKESARETI